ncbi:MAG: TRAP transporter permease, partial [Pseudomonadota bacterium]
LWEFTYTAASCIAGVIALSAAVVGYWLAPMGVVYRWLMAFAGLIFIAPSLSADLAALIIASPAIISQVLARSRSPSEARP